MFRHVLSFTIALALVLLLACPVARAVAPAPALSPATWRGDARALVAAVDSLHPRPWRVYRRAAWDSAAADLEARLPALRYDQAVAAFSRMLGMLGEGHSRLDQLDLGNHTQPTLKALPGPGFDTEYPIQCELFADGLRVVRATRAHAALLGAHVTAIDGRPAGEAFAALAPFIPSDNVLWTRWVFPACLRRPGYLAAAGLASGPAAPLRLTVTDARGRSTTASVPAQRPDTTAQWLAADDGVRAPLPLTRALPGTFAWADLGDGDSTVFVRLRAIVNPPGDTFAACVTRLFAHADSIGARRLVLDVRGNGGGNNYLNQPFVHALIARPRLDRTGGLFVITDRGTFSAAVSLASDLERETHARFVGEPTGGAPNSFGDPAHVTLPASGIVVRISTLYWQGSDPRDPRAFIPPDIPVATTWADWIAHRDPALAPIRAWRPPAGTEDVPPNTRWAQEPRVYAKAPEIAW